MFNIDNGKFKNDNYNNVIKKSKRRLFKSQSPISLMTESDAKDIYNLTHGLNSITEPQLAIRKKGMI